MQLVTVTEAAEALGLSKGTVSPQVNGFIGRGLLSKDLGGRFDLDEYKRLRAGGGINPLMARNRGGELGYEATLAEMGANSPKGEASPLSAMAGAGAAAESSAGAQIGTAHLDEKRIDAELKRIKLARERREIADVGDLDAAGRALGDDLQEMLRRRDDDLAEKLAAESDPALVRAMLADSRRAMLIELAALITTRVKVFDEQSIAA